MSTDEGEAHHFPGDYSFNTGTIKLFSVADYIIFAGLLFISATIGAYFAWKDRREKAIEEFLLAGRRMGSIPVSLSLLASFMSAITLLGTPAEMYNYNTMYWWIGLGYVFCMFGAAHIYIPIFYNLHLTSAYEYLGRRFSKGMRTFASMTFVIQMVLYMSIVLYAPSLALNAVTGFNLWGSIISIGIVCTVYTAMGGMKAVIWTDSVQIIIMIVSSAAILIKAAVVIGPWDMVWESAQRTNRVKFDDFRLDPTVRHSFWSLAFGAYFTWVAVFGVNQAQVQRANSCKSLKTAQVALWLNLPGLCIILYLCCFIGMYMSAFYEKCDPLKSRMVTDSNQIMPMFVMDVLGDVVGFPGVFVAGLFSGALSTISSGLNSVAAVVFEDIVRGYFHVYLREDRARLTSQLLALLFGAICLGLTYVASKIENILQAALTLYGVVGGPLLGIFSLGMFCPWANKWGGYAGLFGGLTFMTWVGAGAYFYPSRLEKAIMSTEYCNVKALGMRLTNTNISVTEASTELPFYMYRVSYLWYSTMAVTVTMTLGLLVSFITGPNNPADVDPKLICPLFDILFPYLPEVIRKPLRFGVIHEGKYYNKSSGRPSVVASLEKQVSKQGIGIIEQRDDDSGPYEIDAGWRPRTSASSALQTNTSYNEGLRIDTKT